MTPVLTVPVLRPPAVIQEMIERLQASPVASDQTFIHQGLVPTLPTLRERVYLIGVTGYAAEPNTRAHHVRNENFGIRGYIEVHQLGDDSSSSAYARAWELLSGLDQALRLEEGLDAGARYNGTLTVTTDEVVPMADGWGARIIFTLGMESVR